MNYHVAVIQLHELSCIIHMLHPAHKMRQGNDIEGVQTLVLKYLSRNPKSLTLHRRFPGIIGNSAADHRRQVGTAGTGAVVGRLFRAGSKAIAAATVGGSLAASYGVGGWLNPATQKKLVSHEHEKSTLSTNTLKLAGLSEEDSVSGH